MTRESRPWFKLYVRDFLGSPKLGRMNAAERGLYLTLLLRSWDEDGYVLDKDALADELDVTLDELYVLLSGRVRLCFFTDDEGRMRNPRLEKEREKAKRIRKTNRDNARARWESDATGCESDANRMRTDATACDSVSVSVSESVSASRESQPRQPSSRKSAPVTDEEFEAMLGASSLGAEARQALRDWREYKRAQYGQQYVSQTWARSISKAERDQARFVAGVDLHIEIGWKNLKLERLDEERPKGQGAEPRLTPRANLQRQNTDVLRRFAESEDAPRIMEIEEGRDD